MKTYAVKEVFQTLQGEGHHAGTSAVFLRLSGCNAWSGLERDRGRDLARTGAPCAAWCDTDFVGGARLTRGGVVAAVVAAADEPPTRPRWVVCTGGEPLLQLDEELVAELHAAGFRVAVETNGSVDASRLGLDWITVSPKWVDDRWVQRRGDELKVVVPGFDLERFEENMAAFAHHFVQPLDGFDNEGSLRIAISAVVADPRWRLGVQLHKLVGLR